MENKILKTPATLEGVSLLKDGSATLRFSTQEIIGEDLVVIKGFHGHFGTLVFSEASLQPADIPKQDPEFEGKSPSQRLRAVIFVLWNHLKENKKTDLKFEDFYSGQLESLITQYKAKLPERNDTGF